MASSDHLAGLNRVTQARHRSFARGEAQEVPPGLAMIANCLTPYRAHLHELIAAGIPELKLHTLITHGDADFSWKQAVPDSINLVSFADADDSPLAGTFHAPLREWRKGGRLIEYLQKNAIQAVICNTYRYVSYLRVIRHCHRAGIPLFVNNDSNIRSELRLSPLAAWAKRRIYAWWLPRVSGVMPMGRLGEEFFLKYGCRREHMYFVPYTPHYEAFREVDQGRLQRFRAKFGLRSDRRYLLYSGRLAPVKRVDLLIDAFAQIGAERPEWDLLIVGDGPLRDELHRRVPAAVASRVVWVGFLEQDQLAAAYHAADVLVLPSDREPWAVVVQEALAAGLPVVASDVVGAAHEIVKNGKSGRVFQAGNLADLRMSLLEVADIGRLDRMKKMTAESLAEWRTRIDPVAEVRRALVDVGVLSNVGSKDVSTS
jgi:glycosyltransferase involved in cell wall biosynthesis